MNTLKAARAGKDLTMIQLADKLNVSRQTVANWESKKTKPSIDDLMQLHYIFEIPLDELMDFFEDKKEEK